MALRSQFDHRAPACTRARRSTYLFPFAGALALVILGCSTQQVSTSSSGDSSGQKAGSVSSATTKAVTTWPLDLCNETAFSDRAETSTVNELPDLRSLGIDKELAIGLGSNIAGTLRVWGSSKSGVDSQAFGGNPKVSIAAVGCGGTDFVELTQVAGTHFVTFALPSDFRSSNLNTMVPANKELLSALLQASAYRVVIENGDRVVYDRIERVAAPWNATIEVAQPNEMLAIAPPNQGVPFTVSLASLVGADLDLDPHVRANVRFATKYRGDGNVAESFRIEEQFELVPFAEGTTVSATVSVDEAYQGPWTLEQYGRYAFVTTAQRYESYGDPDGDGMLVISTTEVEQTHQSNKIIQPRATSSVVERVDGTATVVRPGESAGTQCSLTVRSGVYTVTPGNICTNERQDDGTRIESEINLAPGQSIEFPAAPHFSWEPFDTYCDDGFAVYQECPDTREGKTAGRRFVGCYRYDFATGQYDGRPQVCNFSGPL